MDFQFVFGNPTRNGKKSKKIGKNSKKKVAKRKKPTRIKESTKNKEKSMKRSRKAKIHRKAHRKTKRNPQRFKYTKKSYNNKGKLVSKTKSGPVTPTKAEVLAAEVKYKKLYPIFSDINLPKGKRNKARKEAAKAIRILKDEPKRRKAIEEAVKFGAAGYKTKLEKWSNKSMKKGKKKKAKTVSKKKAKQAKKVKHTKKAKRVKHAKKVKHTKKTKRVKHAKKAKHTKKAHKSRKHRKSKKAGLSVRKLRRRGKSGVSGKFSVKSLRRHHAKSSTRKIKGLKGSIKTTVKRNPFFGGSMNIKGELKSLGTEFAPVFVGGAVAGSLSSIVDRYVGVYLKQYLSFIPNISQASGSIASVVLETAAYIALKKKLGTKGEIWMKGLIAASMAKLGADLAGGTVTKLLASVPGMAGVMYSPMSGVQFTPKMAGISYTPTMKGLPQMGRADFGRADFGEYQESPADFGEVAESDEEPDLSVEGQMG